MSSDIAPTSAGEALLYGKVPPQAVEVEEVVLGTILLDSRVLSTVMPILTPDMFYRESSVKIFAAIQALYMEGGNVDILTVVNKLREHGDLDIAGGVSHVAQLTDRVVAATNIEHHIRIIDSMWRRREFIHMAGEVIAGAYDDTEDHQKLFSSSLVKMLGVVNKDVGHRVEIIRDIGARRISELTTVRTGELLGKPSGLKEIDEYTMGFRGGMLYVIAARPAMGKTAFVVNLMHSMARANIPVGLFSLEMSKEELYDRFLSLESEIDHRYIQSMTLNGVEGQRFDEAHRKMKTMPIYIDDQPGQNIMQLRSKAIEMVTRYGVGALFLDYIQLASGIKAGDSRQQEIGSVSRGLKAIAKELRVPVIVLSQLNRKVEDRAGHKPTLSDLREAGDIEQDSDAVMFLFRPSYYGLKMKDGTAAPKNYAEAIWAKNRHGTTGTIPLKWDGARMKFSNWEEGKVQTSEGEYLPYKDDDLTPF